MSDSSIPIVGHVWSEGDQQPAMGAIAKKKDLTGYTVRLKLKQPDGTIVTRTGVIVVNSAEYSQYTFSWTVTDLVAGDCQLCEVELENPSAEIETGPKFYITVRESL